MRIILTFALIAGITSVVTTPAYSDGTIDFTFPCGGGGTYTVEYAGEPTETPTSGGTLTDGSSCAGAAVIDSSVEIITYDAFDTNRVLTEITLPESLVTLDGTFLNSSIETFTTYSSMTIPASLFQSSLKLRTVNILGSVETISAYAFAGTNNLTSITLPASLKSIEDLAFEGSGLTSINYLGTNDAIRTLLLAAFAPTQFACGGGGTYAVTYVHPSFEVAESGTVTDNSGCIGAVVIDESIETIGEDAFISAAITSITLPASLRSIGENSFTSSGLTSITLPEGLVSIGDLAFANIDYLTSITLPASLVTLGTGVFDGSLIETFTTYSSVNIPASLFHGASNLRSVNILGSVETISAYAFYGTTNLTSITLPTSLKSIGLSAFDSSGLTSITLSEGLITINESAFGASALTSILLPASLRSIGNYAFMDTELTSINIPRGLIDFGERNFEGAFITTINYYGGNETITAALQLNLTDTNTVNTDPAKEYRSAGSDSQIVSLLNRNDANLTLTNYPELDLTGKEYVGTSIYLIHLDLNMGQLQSAVSIAIATAKIGSDARYASSHSDDGAAAAAIVAAAAARLAALNAAASALAAKAAQNATKDLEAFVAPVATPGEPTKPAPSIDTYLSAGIKGVTVGNLDLVNILVKELASTQVTTKALVEIVKVATIVITFSIITNSTQTIIKKSELGSIGISTIAGKDLRAFTAYIATLPVGDRNTPVELVAAAEAFKVKLAADIQRVKDARKIARVANRAAIIAIFKAKR